MLRMMIVGNKGTVLDSMDTLIHLIPGVTIVSAFSNQEALEILAFDQNFHVILLDSGLPLEESLKAFQQIKNQDITTPTVIVTETVSREDYQRMFEVGATEYLQKPYTAQSLLNKLEKVANVNLYETTPPPKISLT